MEKQDYEIIQHFYFTIYGEKLKQINLVFETDDKIQTYTKDRFELVKQSGDIIKIAFPHGEGNTLSIIKLLLQRKEMQDKL